MRTYITILVIIFSFLSCHNAKDKVLNEEMTKSTLTDLEVDHFNIWVNDPKKAKEKIMAIGFSAVPDSLSEIHKGQGTAGRYFNFLNTYLELIFVYDQKELKENGKKNKDLDFIERANFEKNNASPFSIAIKMKDYELEKIPFEKIEYHQDWMAENASIFSAKNSKLHLKEPSIFVVYPEIECKIFESLAALERISTEDPFWKEFYRHPNGAKEITKIIVTSTDLDLNTETIKAVNNIENLIIKNGKQHLMELFFDNNVQGKSFDLRPELPLIINL